MQGFPVIYLLDANAGFATLLESHRRLSRRPDATGVGPAVIVGIGHITDKLYDTEQRERDYIPRDVGSPGRGFLDGGAETFLEFIDTRLKPEIEAHFATDPCNRTVIGHSLSAYFVLWTMMRQPGVFQRFIAISPSLWLDDSLITDAPKDPGGISRAFIAVGQWEESLAPWQIGQANADEIAERREQRGMIRNARAFADALAGHIGPERVHFALYPDEDHASIFTAALGQAMRIIFRDG